MSSEEPQKDVTPPEPVPVPTDLVGATLAAANEVHRVLGPGFPAAIYEKGVEFADETVDLYNNLGMLKMEAQQPKDAIVLFDKAVQQGANRTDVIFNLAFAFVANNDTRSAFRYLGEYINRAGADDVENVKVAHMLRTAMLEELEKEKAKKEEAQP